MHEILDNSNSYHLHTPTVQSYLSLTTLLHVPRRLLQEPGKRNLLLVHSTMRGPNSAAVLASSYNLHLLRPAFSRPHLPPLLHVSLQPPPRIDLRALSRNLLLAPSIQHSLSPHPQQLHKLGPIPWP